MPRVSNTFAILCFLNTILIGAVTKSKSMAFTLEGTTVVLLNVGLFLAAYWCGRRDGR